MKPRLPRDGEDQLAGLAGSVLSRAASLVAVLGISLVVLLAVASGAQARLSPTATGVDCQPATVLSGGSTTCTATVTDQSPSPSTPTGVVTFSGFSGLSGTIDLGLCTISGSGASASCEVPYAPNFASSTTVDILARYAGDGSHDRSSGGTTIDFVISGGAPPPTSKEQCKTGGWRHHAGFENQGDCVSYVATHGKNQAGG